MSGIKTLLSCLCLLTIASPLSAEFVENFDGAVLEPDPSAKTAWAWMAGDGTATMSFSQAHGHGVVEVDSRNDTRNIWWAFVRRSVSPYIDGAALARPDRELRVEAKIRSSAAPRRVNLHFNHSRTTDFHSHLMEYDIPDTENWHVISMTTKRFDALPGDEVFVQLALMDWGQDLFQLEIDYLRVSLVDPAHATADLGSPMPYHPAPLPPGSFEHEVPAAQAAMVDAAWPEHNFSDWGESNRDPVIGIGGTKSALLRFDFGELAGIQPDGWGTLALTTDRVYRAETGQKDFGLVRVVEILAGHADWDAASVTWQGLLAGQTTEDVFNGQMMIDIAANPEPGGVTLIPVSPPVLQRLLSGHSKGLALRAPGGLEATFHSTGPVNNEPRLYFNPVKTQSKIEETQR